MNIMEETKRTLNLRIEGMSMREVKDIIEDKFGALMWSNGGAYPADGIKLQFKLLDVYLGLLRGIAGCLQSENDALRDSVAAKAERIDRLGEVVERLQAAGGQGVGEVKRNDPVSALAIRVLVALGNVTQSDADHAFRLACEATEDEAQRMNIELPWVVRAPALHPPAAPALVPLSWRAVIPGGKRTDEWESARVADYNAGWNDYRKAARMALEKVDPLEPIGDDEVDAKCLTITGHLLSRRERDRLVWRMAEAHHGINGLTVEDKPCA